MDKQRLAELNAERTESLEEKNRIAAELREVNADLADPQTTPTEKVELKRRRVKLVADLAEVEGEIAEINAEIRELSPVFKHDLRSVVSLVAAYIASGDTRPTKEITTQALADLEEITQTLNA